MENITIISGETISLTTIVSPKETGRLMFQFDDDEPTEMGIINDFAAVSFTLKQIPGLSDGCSSIEFKSDTGKKFKIYIKKAPEN